MAIDTSQVAALQAPVMATVAESPDADARWAAWRAKGVAHDRAVRRKAAVAAPILVIIAAALLYATLGF